MISALNADSLIDTTLVRPARRISKTLIKRPARRLSEVVTQLSQRSLTTSSESEQSEKKRVRFQVVEGGSSSSASILTYPSAQSFLPDSDLWYTAEECRQMVMDDLMQVVLASGEDRRNNKVYTRGLESHCDIQRVHRRGATQRYIRTVVRKSYENTSGGSKCSMPLLLRQQSSRNKKDCDLFADSLRRFSVQATSRDMEFAFRLACQDEVEARIVYLEDGTVKSAAAFAAGGNRKKRAAALATITTAKAAASSSSVVVGTTTQRMRRSMNAMSA